jgi:LCP family protein required for cell wall assembly
LLVLVVVGLGVLYQQTHAVAKAIVVPEVRPNPSIATPLVGGVTMLIIGVDERPDHPEEGVRSDTLIVAHLDGTGRWVNLLSIPRDTQVDLLDVGLTKINVAYGQGYARAEELYGEGTLPQQGGMALAAQTVEQFFETAGSKVNIDYTAQINFDGFVGVIDALDGVTIDVPKLIVDDYYPTENYGTMQVEFQPGVQQMDGETALIYARTRHADSDFHRSSRQQQVMRAIVAKLQEKGWFGRIVAVPKLLSGIKGENGEGEEGGENASTPPILTTMPIDRLDMLAGLLSLASGLESDSIGQLRLSPETVPVTEVGSNLIWESAGVQSLARQLKVPPEPEESTEESANEE